MPQLIEGEAMVQSEQSRGEPRFWWVEIYQSGKFRTAEPDSPEGEGTSARRRCEKYANDINEALGITSREQEPSP